MPPRKNFHHKALFGIFLSVDNSFFYIENGTDRGVFILKSLNLVAEVACLMVIESDRNTWVRQLIVADTGSVFGQAASGKQGRLFIGSPPASLPRQQRVSHPSAMCRSRSPG